MTDFSSALMTKVASLRDNPQYSDLEIITRSFHAHKIILSARSSDWGRGVDLSTSVVLDWKAFSDQTCEDILDYIYLDEVKCLVDKTYDDVRVIELLSCVSFFSLNELVSRCEIFLEESKARYPLELHSPAVLMTVALQASSKNQKRPLIMITGDEVTSKNAALAQAGAVIPDSFDDLQLTIREVDRLDKKSSPDC